MNRAATHPFFLVAECKVQYMSLKLPVAVVALGLFVMLIAFAIPPAITASTSTATDTFELDEGETTTVTNELDVTLNESTGSTATVVFQDTETGVTESVTLNESETSTITLKGENVTVTLDESTQNSAQITVDYSPRYGWDDGAKTVAGHLDVILALLAFVLLLGAMGVVMQ